MDEVRKIKKRRVVKAIFTTIILLALLTLFVFASYKFITYYNKKSKLLYNIVYHDDAVPGSMHDIDVYNDKIVIQSTSYCSAKDCEAKVGDKEDLKYKQENVDKFIKFIETHYNKTKIKLSESELSDREIEVFSGLFIHENLFEIAIEDYEYRLEYSDSQDLGYMIYLKENKDILVFKCSINENYAITKIEKYNIDFSSDNMKILRDYIISLMKNGEKIASVGGTLRKDEEPLVNSMIKNDESLLKDVNKVSLSYVVSYSGINCLTPKLYLYSDNTYEYYYTFGTIDEKVIPKTGTYNANIENIINNSPKADTTNGIYYTISDKKNNNSYIIDVTNKELNNLLRTLNVSLAKCLEQQN